MAAAGPPIASCPPAAFRQAQKLGEPPPRNAEAATRSFHDHGTRYRQSRALRRSCQHLRRHGRGRHLDQEGNCPGRSVELSECANDRIGRGIAVEPAAWLVGHDLDAETVAHEPRAPGSLIHIRRDLVERVLERSVRHDEPRQHLRSEDASTESPEPANRPESVSGSSGGGDCGVPVRLNRELLGCEPVRARGSHEVDGVRRALLEQRVELGDRLALRQPTDVDACDPRARGELALGAGEREANEDGQERCRACREREHRRDRKRTPSGATVARRRGVNRRARGRHSSRDVARGRGEDLARN